MNRCHFQLHRLSLGRRLDQCSRRRQAAAGGDLFKRILWNRPRVDDQLHAFEA